MSRYLWQTLVDRETQSSNASTFVEDLPSRGGLSGLDLVFRNTNGATSNLLNWLTDNISKIQIVANGDDIKYSLTAEEAFRHAWALNGRPPGYKFTEQASGVQKLTVPIRFGRYLGDPTFGLDLGKYNNVQIKVEYNMATVNAVGATGFLDGYFEVSALEYITPANQTPAYRGHIVTREIENFTSAASGDKYISIPRSNPILGIGCYCMEDGIEGGVDITHAKLSLDNEATTPYRGRWEHHAERLMQYIDVKELHYNALAADAAYTLTHWASIDNAVLANPVIAAAAASAATFIICEVDSKAGNKVTYDINTFDPDGGTTGSIATLATAQNMDLITMGKDFGYIYFPIGNRADMSDLFGVNESNDVDMILTQGAAGGYCGVVLEEVKVI